MISHLPSQASLLFEAALRSALLAFAVWISLRLFRVRNILAQKAAWGVVLAAALSMPFVLPIAEHWSVLPASVRVAIPADPENLLAELQARIHAGASIAQAAAPATEVAPTEEIPRQSAAAPEKDPAAPTAEFDSLKTSSIEHSGVVAVPQSAAVSQAAVNPNHRAWPSVLAGVLALYLAVAFLLLARVMWGVLAALRLLHNAEPVSPELLHTLAVPLHPAFASGVRCSRGIASPVTIFSSIVLPADYATWPGEKLRIVLAHERSHVEQRDFYLQLLAGIYAAAVWFSPLGWWLKRKLSDLAEAISDRAGLNEAADRASYAQVLLEFAAAPRPTVIGVAMARSGSLSRRIERLLNDTSFRQAFAGSRRALIAVLTIPVALFAATTLVRVQAAGQAPVPPPPPAVIPTAPAVIAPQAPSPVPEPADAISTPDPNTDAVAPTPAPTPRVAQAASPDDAPPPPVILVAPRAPHAPGAMHSMMLIAPAPPVGGTMLIAPRAPAAFSSGIMIRPMLAQAQRDISREDRHGYNYSYSSNGESYALITDGGAHLRGTGSFNSLSDAAIDKAKKQAHGNFLWFTHDGKSYYIDDPATISQIQAMNKPMEELGRQQEELGKKQEALGRQQEELGKQQESASVPTPDMSKEIAAIDEAMAKLKAEQGKNMTQDQFAELQEKLGELQGKLGEIQGRIGSKQGEFGARMGELGAKMGELGEQQGRIGAEQGRLGRELDQKVRSIMDESLKNGKAHPVQ